MAKNGLRFGVFMAPYHRPGENPTLTFGRNLELIQWLDELDYDEVWVGEHHSGGWETIASPELFIASAIERTKHIRLGTGVTSLPYHNPFIVAQHFVQLDHMSRGRVMMGCGPGALPSDAYMMGIEPVTQRRRMDESLSAILRLLRGETVTMTTDWFVLRDAMLHLAPYSKPCFPIVVASTVTPSGVMAAGKHGVGVLSIVAGVPGGPATLSKQWSIAEEAAAVHGKVVSRDNWRVVVKLHVAESDEQAMAEIRDGEREEREEYHEKTLGRPSVVGGDPLTAGREHGTTLVGSPSTVAKGIEKVLGYTQGGCGTILFWANEWATRAQIMHSFELFARYVMPRFQNSLDAQERSNQFVRANRKEIMGRNVEAIQRVYTDLGQAVPEGVRERTVGARDVEIRSAD